MNYFNFIKYNSFMEIEVKEPEPDSKDDDSNILKNTNILKYWTTCISESCEKKRLVARGHIRKGYL
jgi:hypothetical protein